jgi:hypothetical protein
VHAVDDSFRVWCPLVRHDVCASRCVECPRLSRLVVREGQLYVACRADREPQPART